MLMKWLENHEFPIYPDQKPAEKTLCVSPTRFCKDWETFQTSGMRFIIQQNGYVVINLKLLQGFALKNGRSWTDYYGT